MHTVSKSSSGLGLSTPCSEAACWSPSGLSNVSCTVLAEHCMLHDRPGASHVLQLNCPSVPNVFNIHFLDIYRMSFHQTYSCFTLTFPWPSWTYYRDTGIKGHKRVEQKKFKSGYKILCLVTGWNKQIGVKKKELVLESFSAKGFITSVFEC